MMRQYRNGSVNRGDMPFPASLALVGLRNIKDDKIDSHDFRSGK